MSSHDVDWDLNARVAEDARRIAQDIREQIRAEPDAEGHVLCRGCISLGYAVYNVAMLRATVAAMPENAAGMAAIVEMAEQQLAEAVADNKAPRPVQ